MQQNSRKPWTVDPRIELTFGDICVLSTLAIDGSPRIHAFGAGMLGAIEGADSSAGGERGWRWTFDALSTSVFGDVFPTSAEALVHLCRLQ